MRWKTWGVLVVAGVVAIASASLAQDPASKAATVTRASGGSVRTQLSERISLNPSSTLEREWIAVHDPAMPLVLEGTPGVTTAYFRDYKYCAQFALTPTEDLTAVEVRFLVFNVWGDHVRTLSSSDVEDVPAPARHEFGVGADPKRWNVWSENECAEFYASIAYVSRVRTKAGRVIEGDTRAVLEEARKFSAKFTAADLEPQKKPDGK